MLTGQSGSAPDLLAQALCPKSCLNGTPGPIRTGDQLLRRQLLYPLSYGRWHQSGAGDEIRTRDIQLGRLTLYQLSYTRRRTF